MLHVGVIGLGVGERHAWGYLAHRDSHLKLICDVNLGRAQAVAERLGLPLERATADPLMVIDDPDIQAVSIATHDDTHAALTRHALRRGKHVMVEKPLVLHADERERVVSAWRDAGTILTSNMVLRTSKRFIDLKERIHRGDMGCVRYMEGDYRHDLRHKLNNGWRSNLPFYSAVLGGGVHMIDLMLWLIDARPISVVAMASHSGLVSCAFPDTVTVLIRTHDGALLKSTTALSCAHPHFHALQVHGTRAVFVNGLEHADLYVRSAEELGAGTLLDHGSQTGLWRESSGRFEHVQLNTPYPDYAKNGLIGSFVNAVLGRGEPAVSASESFSACDVGLVAWRSMISGQVESIDFSDVERVADSNSTQQ